MVAEVAGSKSVRRRLLDMGLLGASFVVIAKTKRAVLADFGTVAVVIDKPVACDIAVFEGKL